MFFRLNMRVQTRGETKEIFFIMETGHPDMAAVSEALIRDKQLFGIRYEVRPCGPNQRRVDSSYETIIMREAIVSVSEMQDDIYDDDGVALYLLDPVLAAGGAA